MVRLDISGMPTLEVNHKLRELVQQDNEIIVENPHSVHNFATALKGKAKITVEGSTGFYTGGFLQGPTVIIKGNTGLYTGDNMDGGEIIESNEPEEFFHNPQHDRTKLFLSQILQH